MNHRPWLIAHRGAVSVAPENTVDAIRAAAPLGADRVEIDAQLTRDGVPVLMHDWTIDRTTTGHGRVTDLSFRDLRTWRIRNTDRGVPTLEEGVAAALETGVGLVVEFKSKGRDPALVEQCVAVLDRFGALDDAWFWAFEAANLELAGELAPATARGCLSLGLPSPRLCAASEMLVPLAAHLLLFDAGLARCCGRPLINWFTNHPSLALRLARHGAAGVITDRPELLRPVFDRDAAPTPIRR